MKICENLDEFLQNPNYYESLILVGENSPMTPFAKLEDAKNHPKTPYLPNAQDYLNQPNEVMALVEALKIDTTLTHLVIELIARFVFRFSRSFCCTK